MNRLGTVKINKFVSQSFQLIKIIFIATILGGLLIPQVVEAAPITQSEIIKETNQVRIKNGFLPLSVSVNLDLAAQNKVEDMVSKNYWSHETPDGKPFWYFVDKANYHWVNIGENLAANFKTSEGTLDAWLLSSSHRKNILNTKYDEIGVGVKDNIVVVLYGKENKSFVEQIKKISSFFGQFLVFRF